MQIKATPLAGVQLITPRVHQDARGCFLETHSQARYQALLGDEAVFLQDNLSYSQLGVLRGLHFQKSQPQAKLITVLQGSIYDVAVDLRPLSPTFGQWYGVTLQPRQQLWLPEGMAHGFLTLSPEAIVSYKCNRYYAPADEGCLLWSDPDLNIAWPRPSTVSEPILSPKDQLGLLFKDL
ncbi:MAG: dTDP-4-dehydrorhamnose 3,5-epimerase [Neisseriaceae bacterium]|nr:dTDP-4-dehydrorhamnose 3,5-epimerase [Neisseriaceae bacterium]